MIYPRHHTIDHYLNKVRKHVDPYSANVLGKDIVIFPNVMSPLYDRSAQIFISLIDFPVGPRFLDVGCGTGIISLFAAEHGAKDILAIDINEDAIANTRQNFLNHNIGFATALKSDLFSEINGHFNTIFFNAPFHGNEAQDILELGTSDHNYNTLKRFFSEVGNYLEPKGTVMLGFANTGDNELLIELSKLAKLNIMSRKEKENGDWTAYLYTFERMT